MSDIEHLPVRPNINSSYSKKTRVAGDVSRHNILENSADSDIQKFVNKKKTDALELESTPTREEKNVTPSSPKVEGFSWVVIGLAVVIIILIIIVIYYVLKYNEVSNSDIIPSSVVKPSPSNNPLNSLINGVFGGGEVKPTLEMKKEPTHKELDSVLDRLSTIDEEPSKQVLSKQEPPKQELHDTGSMSKVFSLDEDKDESYVEKKDTSDGSNIDPAPTPILPTIIELEDDDEDDHGFILDKGNDLGEEFVEQSEL